MRKNWLAFALGAALGLGLLLGWAWHDGGRRELSAMSAATTLPDAGQ